MRDIRILNFSPSLKISVNLILSFMGTLSCAMASEEEEGLNTRFVNKRKISEVYENIDKMGNGVNETTLNAVNVIYYSSKKDLSDTPLYTSEISEEFIFGQGFKPIDNPEISGPKKGEKKIIDGSLIMEERKKLYDPLLGWYYEVNKSEKNDSIGLSGPKNLDEINKKINESKSEGTTKEKKKNKRVNLE